MRYPKIAAKHVVTRHVPKQGCDANTCHQRNNVRFLSAKSRNMFSVVIFFGPPIGNLFSYTILHAMKNAILGPLYDHMWQPLCDLFSSTPLNEP